MTIRCGSVVVPAFVALALMPAVAQANKLNSSKAVQAVQKRLVREYPIFGAKYELPIFTEGESPTIETSEPSASCHRLTTAKYACSWTANAVAHGLCGEYHGHATVTQYHFGIAVQLSRPIGGDSCGPDGVNDR